MDKALIQEWRAVSNKYLAAFCKKHGYAYEPDMWVGNDPGTIVSIADYFINMDDIRYDIDNDVPENTFIAWYDYSYRLHWLGCKKNINYPSWCKGAPLPYTEEQLRNIEDAHNKVEEAKRNLEEAINLSDF